MKECKGQRHHVSHYHFFRLRTDNGGLYFFDSGTHCSMPESIKAKDGEPACLFPREAGPSLRQRAIDHFRKFGAIMEGVGILCILTIKLLCYLGVGKVFQVRKGI